SQFFLYRHRKHDAGCRHRLCLESRRYPAANRAHLHRHGRSRRPQSRHHRAADFFTDHVDLRPTIMLLLGLKDDYQHDGRAILEMVDPNILPSSLHAHSETLLRLGQVYKQVNAPFGSLAQSALTVSTFAIQSSSDGDAVYHTLEGKIAAWTSGRDTIASEIKD